MLTTYSSLLTDVVSSTYCQDGGAKLVAAEPREERKLLIVIGQVLVDPWLGITQAGQFPTWLRDASAHEIAVRHSHGWRSNALLRSMDRAHEWLRWHGRGRSLVPRIDSWMGSYWLERVPRVQVGFFTAPDTVAWQQRLVDIYALQRWKIMGSLTQALTEDFTHLYFTTASSYIRVNKLIAVVEELPLTKVYAGTPFIDAISGTQFASGANRMLSRDVVESVVEAKERYRNDVMEDAGLGRLVHELGIDLMPLSSVNVPSVKNVEELSDAEIVKNFHFRTTGTSLKFRTDAQVMRALHKRLVKLETDEGIRSV